MPLLYLPVYSLLVLTFAPLLTFPLDITTPNKPKHIVTKLIHRDSIHSPYYNSNDTVAQRAQRALKSSMTRLSLTSGSNDYQVSLLPIATDAIFFMNFSIGEPPIPQFSVMDTGSSLLWVQCVPCTGCSKQVAPMLDPHKSSTYANMSCYDPSCDIAPRGDCDSFDQCVYNQSYINGPSSTGVLATEQLTFETPDDGTIIVPDAIFGCGHANGKYKDPQFTGVFGLGYEAISLIPQLGSRFSYCVGDITDIHYSYNKLVLGVGARMEGYSTPLQVFESQYYITLQGISVGEKRLKMDANVFKRVIRGEEVGVPVDSGSALTFLPKVAYEQLHDEIQRIVDGVLRPVGKKGWSLCYKGTVRQDLMGFPVVTFHFAWGADLVLDPASLFIQVDTNNFCSAVLPSDFMGGNFITIGIMAQQYYNIGYDILENKLYFQRIDCELLDD